MKKSFLSVLFSLALGFNSYCGAQVVTVDGVGADKESALKDAMRTAVERVVGVYVDSRTLVRDSAVELDEVYAKAQGFVKDVQILNSSRFTDGYRLTAKIDVNTNPNSQLMNRVAMILSLNDPRIAVHCSFHPNFTRNNQNEKYLMVSEAAMNEKLISLGFNHVVNSSKITDMDRNLQLNNTDTDYIVLCKLDLNTNEIKLPAYESLNNGGGYDPNLNTGLIKTKAEIDAKILKTDTQEIIGEFHVESDGIKDSANSVENDAVRKASAVAADKVRKVFARKAASISNGVELIAHTSSQDKVTELAGLIKATVGVNDVQLRSFQNGVATYEIDTDLKPLVLFRMLKEKSKTNLFMEKASANIIEISI